nr:arylamine N-acetyltransferase [uncultured Halomonas sp.]
MATPYLMGHVLHLFIETAMLYAFYFLPLAKIDLIVGNWYVSTHPESPFRNKLIASRVDEHGVRHTLSGNKYQRHQVGQPSQSKILDDADEILMQLKDVFLMDSVSQLTPSERRELTVFLENTA